MSIVRDVARREVLFVEGDQGHSLYLVERGAVQLHKTSPEGSEVVIKVAQAGEVFAEVTLFEEDRFPVTAVALTDSTVVLFPKAGVNRLLEEPGFRRDFMAMLMRKQRYLAARIYDLTSREVEERLLMFLREQLKGGAVGTVTVSKKDVAAAIGTTPETLSRAIQRLDQAGTLRWKGKAVELAGEG
jgi:CRP/FNR family transcriptional regulator